MDARKTAFALSCMLLVVFLCGCSTEEPVKMKNCTERAMELIPKRITLVLYGWNSTEKEYIWAFFGNDTKKKVMDYALYWNDGTKFETQTACFMKGTQTGQSVNYYYQIYCGKTKKSLEYSKKVINDLGIIKGTTRFSFIPLLKVINDSQSRVFLFEGDENATLTMDFSVQSNPKFVTCKWVLDNGTVIDDFVPQNATK